MATATEQLRQTWESHRILSDVLATVDHKKIGIRYLVTTSVFFFIGGIEALTMRSQLARPENRLLDPDQYNELFTMHGTTMIFLVVMPMLTGAFGNYLIPLMIGARDMAFPRLNALSYWIFLAAGLFMYSSFLVGSPPDGGWFAYTPLTDSTFSTGNGMDFWTLGLIFLGISTTAGAVNFIVTIFALRAPGMSLNRMPLFVWTMLATAFAILFALPALTLDAALLFLDREFGARFFDPAANGSPLLWQHLFWVFGHPDVYIMFLPAVGIVSSIVPVFSRRPIVAYAWLALAAVATGFIGFGVWVHHMFATGLPVLPLSFFSAASLLIVIPSGIQVFAWIATLWTGRPVLTPALLWVIGFIVIFVMGGVTGVMVASIPFDWQVHDSYFVVAHFHYVLVGSAMFAILGGITYWLPKMSGRLMHDPLNHVSFWTVFAGFNLTFFPMHIAGLLGMPRRVYTYPDGVGLEALNLLETIGAFLLAAGLLMFAVNVIWALIAGERAGANPWGANTLEWATSSPPPPYNFAAIPAVRSADPLWERDQGTDRETLEMREYLETPHAGLREMAATSPLDADPARVLTMPGDSLWPIALAISLATGFVGLLSDVSLVWAIGGVLSLICIAGWAWPEHRRLVE